MLCQWMGPLSLNSWTDLAFTPSQVYPNYTAFKEVSLNSIWRPIFLSGEVTSTDQLTNVAFKSPWLILSSESRAAIIRLRKLIYNVSDTSCSISAVTPTTDPEKWRTGQMRPPTGLEAKALTCPVDTWIAAVKRVEAEQRDVCCLVMLKWGWEIQWRQSFGEWAKGQQSICSLKALAKYWALGHM